MDGLDAAGKLFTAPLAWTDAGEEDPFRVLSSGRAYGRVEDLLRLARLLEELGR